MTAGLIHHFYYERMYKYECKTHICYGRVKLQTVSSKLKWDDTRTRDSLCTCITCMCRLYLDVGCYSARRGARRVPTHANLSR